MEVEEVNEGGNEKKKKNVVPGSDREGVWSA